MIPNFLRQKPFLPLITERLTLRPPKEEDIPRLTDLFPSTSLQDWTKKITSSWEAYQKGESLFLVIEHIQEKMIIGSLEISQEFSCSIEKEFWGKGYGYEASNAFIYFIFSLFELQHISATLFTDQAHSLLFLEKLGFRLRSVEQNRESYTLTKEGFLKNLLSKKEKPLVWAVAGILMKADGTLLLSRRQAHQTFPSAWEFPGGKIEALESPDMALIREIEEEVGVTLRPHGFHPLTFLSYPSKTFHVVIHFYMCFDWEGEPYGKEGQEVVWVAPTKLPLYPTLSINIPLFHRLADELPYSKKKQLMNL